MLQVAEVHFLEDESVDTPLPTEDVLKNTPLATPVPIDHYPESPPGTARSTLSRLVMTPI